VAESKSPEEIQAEIEAQRERLADTVDQLSAKLDVKSRARSKVADVKDRATTAEGSPRPEVLAAAGSLAAMVVVLLVWRLRRDH
jgi:nucleotide-binding universal stress UspA family protein